MGWILRRIDGSGFVKKFDGMNPTGDGGFYPLIETSNRADAHLFELKVPINPDDFEDARFALYAEALMNNCAAIEKEDIGWELEEEVTKEMDEN